MKGCKNQCCLGLGSGSVREMANFKLKVALQWLVPPRALNTGVFFYSKGEFQYCRSYLECCLYSAFLSESPFFFDITYERGTVAEMKLNITMRILFITISDIL